MPFMPFLFPVWVLGPLSLATLGGGAYLLYAWYAGIVVGTGYLIGGALMTLWGLFGRFVVLWLARRPDRDPIRRDRSPDGRRIDGADATPLHVETYGPADAPPIVFTHGWGLDSTAWHDAKVRLAGRYRLIVWDLPGNGLSGQPASRDFTLEKLARDLDAVLALAGGKPAVLVGHSIGGMIQLTHAKLFPEKLGREVAGMALVNTTYTNPVRTTVAAPLWKPLQKPLLEPLLGLSILFSPALRVGNAASYLNGASHLNSAFTGFAGHESRERLEFATRYNLVNSPAVIARGMLGMMRYDATEVLPRLTVPALVVTAPVDRMLIPQASEEMAAAIPGAELVVLRPAGHNAPIEQHGAFVDAIDRFAARCFASAPPRAAGGE